MATPRFSFRPVMRGLFTVLLVISSSTRAQETAPASVSDQPVRVQITEESCLRTLLLLDQDMADMENRLSQQLVDKDFRVFPSAEAVPKKWVSPEEMRAAGEKANADLVLFATTKDRLKNKKEDFLLYEGECTVQIYSRVSGELLVTKTARVNGARTTDEVEAKRSAREKAVDAAAADAVERSLTKAHKILVHDAVIVNVFSESALLAIMEYMQKMEGIYHVKRLSFDRKTNEANIEIIGSPHSETVWRAYLEKLPKTKVNVRLTPNDKLHNKYPSWFQPGS
jgi:hypothetical protein